MATQVQSAGWGYRLSRGARRVLRGYGQMEHRAARWTVANGLPVELASIGIWGVRLAVAGMLVYTAFWLAIVILIVLASAWYGLHRSSNADDDWRFPTWEELRWSPGYDPVPYEDIEHPDYPDKLCN